MAKNTAMTPYEKKRLALLEEMTPKCQSVAKDFDKKIATAAKGLVMIRYDMGSRLSEVIKKEAEYGSNAVNLLADYLNLPGGATTMYALRNFAEEFAREFVQQQVMEPMVNGRPLETGHFLLILRVKEEKDQIKLFNQVRRECLSVNSLESEIRAKYEQSNTRSGGRKPQKPSSPAAGLQKLFSTAQKLDNFLGISEESIFEPLEEIAPEEINEQLFQKFEKAAEQLESLAIDTATTIYRMSTVRDRLRSVVTSREAAAAAKAAAEDDAEVSDSATRPAKKSQKGGKKVVVAASKSKGGGTASRKKTAKPTDASTDAAKKTTKKATTKKSTKKKTSRRPAAV